MSLLVLLQIPCDHWLNICCCLLAKYCLTFATTWTVARSSDISPVSILEWIAIFFWKSSQFRGQIHVSCTGRQILYRWATKEAQLNTYINIFFSSVQFSCVRIFATKWTIACQASLSIANTGSSPKLMSIESLMPSSHLSLYRLLLLLPPIPPSIRAFSNESTLLMRWPKYWSFSFNIRPSNEHPGLISFRMDWLDLLQSKGLSRVFSNTTVQKHQLFGAQHSL